MRKSDDMEVFSDITPLLIANAGTAAEHATAEKPGTRMD
jgi:hypothetical protein